MCRTEYGFFDRSNGVIEEILCLTDGARRGRRGSDLRKLPSVQLAMIYDCSITKKKKTENKLEIQPDVHTLLRSRLRNGECEMKESPWPLIHLAREKWSLIT